MPIILYQAPPSSPCRAVLMTARALNLDVELKLVDLLKRENMSKEYLAMNPLHSIPTMDDNGFILWESRAIMMYLVNKYCPDSTLYPKEPTLRAQVDNMIFFDVATFYKPWAEFTYPQVLMGVEADPEKLKAVKVNLSHLENFLSKTKYVASDELSLADFGLYAEITFTEIKYKLITEEYPAIQSWIERMRELPYNKEVNDDALDNFKLFLKDNPNPMGSRV